MTWHGAIRTAFDEGGSYTDEGYLLGGKWFISDTVRFLSGDPGSTTNPYVIDGNDPYAKEQKGIDWSKIEGDNPEGLYAWDHVIRGVQGITNVANFGFSNYWTKRQLGEDRAGIYQQGAAYWAGTGVGVVGTFWMGGTALKAISGVATTGRVAYAAGVGGTQVARLRGALSIASQAAGGFRNLAAMGAYSAYAFTGDAVGVYQGATAISGGDYNPLNFLGLLPTLGWARTMRFGRTRLSPMDFGIKSIADDPRLAQFWQESIDGLRSATRARDGKHVKSFFNTIESGMMPDGETARNAFNSVRDKFVKSVKLAVANGESFNGYVFENIHHWHWPISSYAVDALDARQLFPVTKLMHKVVHYRTAQLPIFAEIDNPIHHLD